MVAIEIRDLVVEVDKYPIVDGLTLDIGEREHVPILGTPEDAMTILYVLSGILLPSSGEIWIYNLPPRQAYQRGLIRLLPPTKIPEDGALFNSTVPIAIVSYHPSITLTESTIVYPVSDIAFSNKFIQKTNKTIYLRRR